MTDRLRKAAEALLNEVEAGTYISPCKRHEAPYCSACLPAQGLLSATELRAALAEARRPTDSALEALEAARIWWLGNPGDGTPFHDMECDMVNLVDGICDCPGPSIISAILALRKLEER